MVVARAANTRNHRVVAADNFCHFKCRRVLFLIVISQPKSSFAEDIYKPNNEMIAALTAKKRCLTAKPILNALIHGKKSNLRIFFLIITRLK